MTKRILVVEDDKGTAQTFGEFLTESGYDVTVVLDGYDALEKVVSGSYDLITMDLKMPRLGGIQATELIRLRRVSTPVIVISGFVPDFQDKLAQLGIRHVLQKPVDLKDLLETVKLAIEEG